MRALMNLMHVQINTAKSSMRWLSYSYHSQCPAIKVDSKHIDVVCARVMMTSAAPAHR